MTPPSKTSKAAPRRAEHAPAQIAPALLAWYDAHARTLPWRARPGVSADPYAVWLSEVMLQQTTVATVGPYFRDFLSRWPTVEALAAADLDDVLKAWAGLGYYSRARNLHACARAVAAEHGGRFPDTPQALQALPGIGPYTAAAIAAIAFDHPATVVDGNVERVVSRLFAIETPLPASKPDIRACADLLTPRQRPGDFAQAMMDLGATICAPKRPACSRCPLERACAGAAQGIAETLPRKAPKAERPTRFGACFWVTRPDGAALLRQRPPKGLLGGMTEVPTTQWQARAEGMPDAMSFLADAPLEADWQRKPGHVRHTFTHFHLELAVFVARVTSKQAKHAQGRWIAAEEVDAQALPTVMRKVVALARDGDGPLFEG